MNKEYNSHSNFDTEEIFQDSLQEAQELMKDPGKVDKLLKRLDRRLRKGPKLLKALAFIPQMGMLVNSYFRGEYTEIPIGILTAVIGVLVYFVAPVDAIPDFLPFGVGLLDDAAVAAGAMYLIRDDLDEYKAWRICQGLDEEETFSRVEAAIE